MVDLEPFVDQLLGPSIPLRREALQQARILYQEVGARTRGVEVVEKIIARLQRPPKRKSRPE